MAEKDKIRSLELAIEEQRRDYDQVDTMYESARSKNYSMIAVVLGLLAYLYTANGDGTLQERLFIPNEHYGIIFYAISVALIIYGMGKLVKALKSRPWSTAYDNDQDEDKMKNYEKYLEYVRKRYLKCSETNSKSYREKQELLDDALWPLLIGAIMLVLLKVIGG